MKPNKKYSMIIAVCMAIIFYSLGQRQVSAQQAGEKKATDKNESSLKDEFSDVEVTGWRIRDFKPYVKAIQELEKLNKEYSDNLLKLAIDEYSTGLDILEDMENEVIKLKAA